MSAAPIGIDNTPPVTSDAAAKTAACAAWRGTNTAGVLSGVLLARVWRIPFSLFAERRWLAVGAALLVTDVVLKWALAPAWATLLRGLAGW